MAQQRRPDKYGAVVLDALRGCHFFRGIASVNVLRLPYDADGSMEGDEYTKISAAKDLQCTEEKEMFFRAFFYRDVSEICSASNLPSLYNASLMRNCCRFL